MRMKKSLKMLYFGSFPLKRAFWFYGNIIPLIYFICLFSVVLFFQESPLESILNLKFTFNYTYQKLIVIVLGAIFLIYAYISTVGIWRSANKYEGKKYWSILAKLSILLAMLSYLKDMYKYFF